MSKIQKLIDSLSKAVRALETDSVNYKWQSQHSCNCGVVFQAILGLHNTDLELRISEEKLFEHKMFQKDCNGKAAEKTWKNAVKAWCPITNKPLKQIFIDLEEAGLTKEDICHLEYMDNKAILARSGVKTYTQYSKDVQTGTNYVPSTTFWGKIFKRKIAVPVYEKKVYQEPDKEYYMNRGNLIKYLKGWISILREERDPIADDLTEYTVNQLNELLLVALAEDDYTQVVKLRDAINECTLTV